jgi:hypothetical protein
MRKYTKMHILFPNSGSSLSINLETNQVENWLFDKPIETDIQTRDECHIKFEHEKGMVTYRGYVPDYFPGEHYGDFVMLNISEKGIIKDLEVTDEKIEEFFIEMKPYSVMDLTGFDFV